MQCRGTQRGSSNKNLVLVAMIFAVAMGFIDQTIVALAIPDLQRDLSLSSTGAQWIVNGYLLSLAALFAFGGKLADVLGHRRMVVIGVAGFAVCSALCGATPTGGAGETWIIVLRVLQGGFAALMFPAALGIVVAAFPLAERGRALAAFFGITGALTAVGPLAGGYLTEWTWRAIFWINIPVAIIALVLTARAKPANTPQPGRIDFRAAVLISAAMGLVVLGLQQAGVWGWLDVRTIGAIVVGLILLGVFVVIERSEREPLIRIRALRGPGLRGRQRGAHPHVGRLHPVLLLRQRVRAGGPGLLGDERRPVPARLLRRVRDRVAVGRPDRRSARRAPGAGYGEVTGITQTVRNLGASVGLAVMGPMFTSGNVDRVSTTLVDKGVPTAQAESIAHGITAAGGGGGVGLASRAGAGADAIVHAVKVDIAHSTQTVVWIMAGVMAAAFIVARVGLPKSPVAQPAAEAEPAVGAPEPQRV